MNATVLRVGAAVVAAAGAAAGVIVARPDLVSLALPPAVASSVSIGAAIVVAVLHELAHTTAPAASPLPEDPATPKETP